MPSQAETPAKFTGWASKGKDQPLEKWSYQPRPLGSSDVEIKISHCGICASDVYTIDSGWGPTKYPCIVGHEIVGHVTQVGNEVQDLQVGDRVGMGAQARSCLECEECEMQYENYCQGNMVQTYNSVYDDGKQAQGGYADYVRVHHHWAFRIPDEIPSAEAASLFCAGITVYSPLKQANVGPDTKVGVVAIGGLGHLALQFARALGARKITAVSHSTSKKEDAMKLGATDFVATSNPEEVKAANRSLDTLIVTSCGPYTDWTQLFSLVRTWGKVIVVGMPEGTFDGIPPMLMGVRAISLIGSIIGPPRMIKEMLDVAAKKGVRVWCHKRPMSSVNETLAEFRDGKARFRYVLTN
ncbi:MAG: putative mannitol dehydrogenase [Piptocephalis tieghemiana]|nr:MAG: putative mannitol dehydrogenase [Piptocephalis tieghemiana]